MDNLKKKGALKILQKVPLEDMDKMDNLLDLCSEGTYKDYILHFKYEKSIAKYRLLKDAFKAVHCFFWLKFLFAVAASLFVTFIGHSFFVQQIVFFRDLYDHMPIVVEFFVWLLIFLAVTNFSFGFYSFLISKKQIVSFDRSILHDFLSTFEPLPEIERVKKSVHNIVREIYKTCGNLYEVDDMRRVLDTLVSRNIVEKDDEFDAYLVSLRRLDYDQDLYV